MNNEDKLSLETKSKILKLRNILGTIANCSYAYSKINKEYPLEYLNEENGQKIVAFYEQLLSDAFRAIEPHEKEAAL